MGCCFHKNEPLLNLDDEAGGNGLQNRPRKMYDAAANGDEKLVTKLLNDRQTSVELNYFPMQLMSSGFLKPDGLSALSIAIEKNQQKIADLLLTAGADIYLFYKTPPPKSGSSGYDPYRGKKFFGDKSPICLALMSNNVQLVHRLLSIAHSRYMTKDPQLLLMDWSGRSLYFYAKSSAALNLLLQFRVVPTSKDLSRIATSPELLWQLSFIMENLQGQININDTSIYVEDQSLLHLAAAAGAFENVKVLINSGINLQLTDRFGKTALEVAKTQDIADFIRTKQMGSSSSG